MVSKAEIVIIGGGISGCAIAYNLAKKGMKNIVLLEKEYISSGATGRCGAGIRQQWATEMNCQVAKLSREFFETAEEKLGYDHDIEFKQKGYLILAATEEEDVQSKKNVALQNSLGIDSRYISLEDARELVPILNTKDFISATFCKDDGHLNPWHTTLAFAKASERLGVKIYTHTEVKGIDHKNGEIFGVETNRGYIQTNQVVNAAGGHAQVIGDMVGIELPVYSERHQILVTEPVAPILDPMIISFSKDIYCQQVPHGAFIMGRGGENEPRDLRNTCSWDFLEKMTETALSILPNLKKTRVLRQWSGMYNISPDKQPIYGDVPGMKGFFLAVGFSGHGFMFGPATGLLMAEFILGEKTTLPIDKLHITRFEKGELMWEASVV
ncbi:NAD(P)/FAD-dependent oxidoreductase [Isachenkonia alkalipeptolytica]|uniref:FAD-binding oxidoreductase n=1 Tax=Isachenkonia alkalipeptolytica TaxID=2565777 RepID=A0AA43XKX2_9CLOT|nr:FAD-binding oxidoreductase [Isachenkonia alkalipeptolytica]NBG88743.1 FAD-binding oxidoreductase [Isachenkonia alkalipeptolytica]